MPVSRKRKKKNRSPKTSTRVTGGKLRFGSPDAATLDLAQAFSGFADVRAQLDARRASLAAAAAESLVGELVELAPQRPGCELEDELCVRLGRRLHEAEEGPLDDHVGPNQLAEATVTAAAAAVRAALDEATPDGWRAPWRVLTAVARIVHFSLSGTATDAIKQLRGLPGGRVLPKTPDDPTVIDQVLWARDAYGSRFGVTAGFSTPDGPDRWYLWDIDACGHDVFTVHSAYYPDREQAVAAWRAGVGRVAAGGSAFTPVDDAGLLVELLPAEEGFMRMGGESAAQFAEYHRSRRLAEAALESVGPRPAARRADLDAATAAVEFTAWLPAYRAGQPLPDGLDELVTELANSWGFGTAALYATCSPHRVALAVSHLRDYYQDDFAAELVALLPDWISWLAERNGALPHLVERCRPYALGEPHAGLGSADAEPDYLARVIE